jgi:hypothetical protein
LRPLRAEGTGLADHAASDPSAGAAFAAEAEAIAGVFAAKMAGLRRRVPPWEIPAAMRALRDERQAAFKSLRERRKIAREGDKPQPERAGVPPYARPS